MKKNNFRITQAKESFTQVHENIDKKIKEFENYISEAREYNLIETIICLKLQEHITKIKTSKELFSEYDANPLMIYLEYLNIQELIYKSQYNDLLYMTITLETGSGILKRLGKQIAS